MRRSRDFKDVWCLFGMTASLGCLAFAFIGWPNLPLSAQSPEGLANLARDKTRQSVLNTSLPSNDGDWTSQDIAIRWQQIENEDPSVSRRAALEKARERFAARTWPVLTRRGYVQKKECWIVVSSWRSTLSGTVFVCRPSEREKANMVAEGTDRNTEIAVVEAVAPYRVLAHSTRRAQAGIW